MQCEQCGEFFEVDSPHCLPMYCPKCEDYNDFIREVKMENYVLGFMFHGDKVLLIEKLRPDWQAGKLNGVGGKIEKGETPEQAMVREFREETGIETSEPAWQKTLLILGSNFELNVFRSLGRIDLATQMTDERLRRVFIGILPNLPTLQNIQWIVPLCRDTTISFPIIMRDLLPNGT